MDPFANMALCLSTHKHNCQSGTGETGVTRENHRPVASQ